MLNAIYPEVESLYRREDRLALRQSRRGQEQFRNINSAGPCLRSRHTHVKLIGTAKLTAANRDRRHGTLTLIGQPGEETFQGGVATIKDGLPTHFPKPDFALAIDGSANQPVGLFFFPPWMLPTVITTGSRGLFSRDPIVCSASLVRAAITTGSIVF
jgi:hypothetical protein